MANKLYYGDNLHVLRRYVPDASVDLIYLDPPFNSERAYSAIFKGADALESDAQVQAFTDFWRWDDIAQAHFSTLTEGETAAPEPVANLLVALRSLLNDNNLFAYLVMMTVRLLELRRVLKPTGSLYLHCDPTASHYLKLVLDTLFGAENFRNEIIWQRATAKNDSMRFGRSHDVIFFYTAGAKFTWNPQYGPLGDETINHNYTMVEAGTERRYQLCDLTANKPGGDVDYEWHGARPYKGRHWAFSRENMDKFLKEGRIVFRRTGMPRLKKYLDEQPGVPLHDIWGDIRLSTATKERLGYPTQKPVALLERILTASSNPGDVVLDPFCGCGTAIEAAERLKRRWIGIDITHLAISIIRRRFKALPNATFEVRGEPADAAGAQELVEEDPYQFQWWALDKIGARPSGNFVGREGKKGADRGVDGVIHFRDREGGPAQRIIVQVKGGHHVGPAMIRDLRGTMEREGAAMGVFLTLHEATEEMVREAKRAEMWTSETWHRHYPRIQILTVKQVLAGTKKVEFPGHDVTLRPVHRQPQTEPEQLTLVERPPASMAPPVKAADLPRTRHSRVRTTATPGELRVTRRAK